MQRQNLQWPHVLATTPGLGSAWLFRAVLPQDPTAAQDAKRIHYSPLETPRTIRLIHAHRSRADGNIIIQMEHCSLPDARFTAISYLWGAKRMHHQEVMINGRRCQVQASAYSILSLICDNPGVNKDYWFWIDSLCIDQENPSEKSEQVKVMGTLYKTASRTLVWLGEDTSEVHGALDLLKYLAWFGPDNRGEISISPEEWETLGSFWKRPWWTRVWTLQEFFLPARLTFYLGNEKINRRDWKKAITIIRGYLRWASEDLDDVPMDHAGFGNQWAWRRLLQWKESPEAISLVALMAYMGHHKATKEQERVYALLGICSNADRAIVGDPDYESTVEQVYTRLVVEWIRRHQSLDIVCLRALFTREPSPGLPTWVPDFRCWVDAASRPVPSMVSEPSRHEIGNLRAFQNPKHGVVDPNLVYDASAGLVAEFSKDELLELRRGRHLPCKGIVLDVIDGLGPVREYEPDGTLREYSSSSFIQSKSRANTESRGAGADAGQLMSDNAVSYDVPQHLVRSLSLDRAGRYLIWPAPVEDYVTQLRDRHLSPMSSHQGALDRFLAANRELCILGATLEEHLKALDSRPHAAGKPDGDLRSFSRAARTTVGWRSWDCRLITTDRGRLGMAPKQAMRRDIVAVLIGCSVPVVLRRSKERDGYEVVGEAFMPGYMQGEAIREGLGWEKMILI